MERGELRRALSLSPDGGVTEDRGERPTFELPFWDGQHPVGDGYPLPFHPLELAEAARRELFGFVVEGTLEDEDPEPDTIRLTGFRADAPATNARPAAATKRPWWQFWK